MVKLWENDISPEPMPLIGDVGSGLKKNENDDKTLHFPDFIS